MPKPLRRLLHLLIAFFGALYYGFPSRKLFVIGITGTSGKSSTISMLRHVLTEGGYTVGALSTIDFVLPSSEKLNDKKMTMLGRAAIQKYLREMVEEGCDVAIVETTSEGALQHRHRFINYDMILLTNLYPEHIEAHGSFENYREWKRKIFAYVAHCKPKHHFSAYKKMTLCNPRSCVEPFARVPKTAIVNAHVPGVDDFVSLPFSSISYFGDTKKPLALSDSFRAKSIEPVMLENNSMQADGMHCLLNGHTTHIPLYGEHNSMNVAGVAAVARLLGLSWDTILRAAESLPPIPGRIEFIPEAEKKGFRVIVDYAFEPVALQALYSVVEFLSPKRIIHVAGATGGGRDTSRREINGKMMGEKCAVVIVTNEDPYDEDPLTIMKMVQQGAEAAGKKEGKDLFVIPDRGEAIDKAISLAEPGDIVLVTGKGSEQAICTANGQKIPWDDRSEVQKALERIE